MQFECDMSHNFISKTFIDWEKENIFAKISKIFESDMLYTVFNA